MAKYPEIKINNRGIVEDDNSRKKICRFSCEEKFIIVNVLNTKCNGLFLGEVT
jgi:predicted secreted protein